MKTHPQYEPWLQGMLIIAKHYRLDFSAEHVRVTINHESHFHASWCWKRWRVSSGWGCV